MSPSAFGEVQTLISLFLQLTIFLNVLSLVAVNLIANDKNGRAQRIVTELQLTSLWLSVAALIIGVIAATWLKSAFRFESAWPFILLTIALIAAVPFTFQTAYLRGLERFGATSLANVLVAGGKIVFSVGLVLVGLGTSGAIGGLIAAQLVGLVYALLQAKRGRMKQTAQALRTRWWPDMRVVASEIKYVGYALIGSLGVMLLLSLDVIVVKYFFDAHTAGLYAGVATVARIIFFLTASIAQVLLPAVKLQNPAHENRALLTKSALILTSLSAPVLVLCMAAPGFVMNVLMGSEYSQFAGLLPLLSLAIFFISILNLLILYCLALRRYVPALLTMTGTIITYGVMLFYHSTLHGIVVILLCGSMVIACSVTGWLIFKRQGV